MTDNNEKSTKSYRKTLRDAAPLIGGAIGAAAAIAVHNNHNNIVARQQAMVQQQEQEEERQAEQQIAEGISFWTPDSSIRYTIPAKFLNLSEEDRKDPFKVAIAFGKNPVFDNPDEKNKSLFYFQEWGGYEHPRTIVTVTAADLYERATFLTKVAKEGIAESTNSSPSQPAKGR